MSRYFNYFPKTLYSANNNNSGLDTVTNIIARFSFEEKLKENSSTFYKYQVQDGDTPEIIATKFYDNPERHWIVLLFNDMIDSQYDWPLQSSTVIEYIDSKYSAQGAANTTPVSGLRWAQQNIHSYYKVLTETSENVVNIIKIQVDSNAYSNIAFTSTNYLLQNNTTFTQAVTKETKSYYEYEIEENEKKREIKLLKREFVPEVEKEFKRVVRR